jgi:hypothetical protein
MCVYYNATIFALDSFVIDTSPHFWVATNSGNTNGLVLYRDGIAVGSGTKSLTALSGNLQIGGGGSWNGTVSQQMLWVGRALSAADVAQLYADRYAMIAPPGYRR